jgi:hypothetical protein
VSDCAFVSISGIRRIRAGDSRLNHSLVSVIAIDLCRRDLEDAALGWNMLRTVDDAGIFAFICLCDAFPSKVLLSSCRLLVVRSASPQTAERLSLLCKSDQPFF